MAKVFRIFQNRDKKIIEAKEAESEGDIERAIKLYEEINARGNTGQFIFDRLMILYRKLKQFKDELRVINKGIEIFQQENKKLLQQNISGKKNKKAIEKLSNVFMKTSGLIDKKGREVHLPEPVNKWMKRKSVVEKRLKKKYSRNYINIRRYLYNWRKKISY